MTDDDGLPVELVHAQREVARVFFDLPDSRNFLLAGGTALLAMDYIHRRSHDVDLFVSEGGVASGHDSFVAAATERTPTEMTGAISRFDDDELPVDDPEELRRFYVDWRSRLRD